MTSLAALEHQESILHGLSSNLRGAGGLAGEPQSGDECCEGGGPALRFWACVCVCASTLWYIATEQTSFPFDCETGDALVPNVLFFWQIFWRIPGGLGGVGYFLLSSSQGCTLSLLCYCCECGGRPAGGNGVLCNEHIQCLLTEALCRPRAHWAGNWVAALTVGAGVEPAPGRPVDSCDGRVWARRRLL